MTSETDPMRWVRRGVAALTLVLGWLFILWHNKFHLTVPVLMVAIGYLAVVASIFTLWRVGATAVGPEDDGPDAWTRSAGVRGELEKEKKALLKAIKEAEFDHAMGKLSQADADQLIQNYRARAIEVIKQIDRIDSGQAGSVREQIQREVQARLEVAGKGGKGGKKAKAKSAAKAEAKTGDAKAVKARDANTRDAKAQDAKASGAKADESKDEAAEAGAAKADVPDEPPPVEEPAKAETSEATS